MKRSTALIPLGGGPCPEIRKAMQKTQVRGYARECTKGDNSIVPVGDLRVAGNWQMSVGPLLPFLSAAQCVGYDVIIEVSALAER